MRCWRLSTGETLSRSYSTSCRLCSSVIVTTTGLTYAGALHPVWQPNAKIYALSGQEPKMLEGHTGVITCIITCPRTNRVFTGESTEAASSQ
jgi:hypothetical protein